jgi:hypothetical protein
MKTGMYIKYSALTMPTIDALIFPLFIFFFLYQILNICTKNMHEYALNVLT